jgi:hypothetical protein
VRSRQFVRLSAMPLEDQRERLPISRDKGRAACRRRSSSNANGLSWRPLAEAAHCEKRAASAGDLAAKNAFVAAAICWRDLAQCWRELPKEPLDRPEDPPAGLGR